MWQVTVRARKVLLPRSIYKSSVILIPNSIPNSSCTLYYLRVFLRLMHLSGSVLDSIYLSSFSLSFYIFFLRVLLNNIFNVWILFLFSLSAPYTYNVYKLPTHIYIYLLNASKCKTQHSSAAVSFFGMSPLVLFFSVPICFATSFWPTLLSAWLSVFNLLTSCGICDLNVPPVSVTFVLLLSAFCASPERSVSNGYFNAAAFLFVYFLFWLPAFIALYN